MLVAIFGTGRNGSTLMGRLLDGISAVYVHPLEVNFLSAINDLAVRPTVRRAVVQNATVEPLANLEKPLEKQRLVRFYEGQVREIWENYLGKLHPGSFPGDPLGDIDWHRSVTPEGFAREFLRVVAAWCNPGQSARAYVFKSIETPYIEEYEKRFPEMRFIHLMRGPVEVCSSQKRTLMFNKSCPASYLGFDNLEVMVERRWLPHARMILAKRKSERHRMVRYEDLVSDPESVIKGVCTWLGWEMPRDPRKQTVLGGRVLESLPANPSKKGVRTPIEVDSRLGERFGYEPVLTKREIDLIVARTYAYARALGYMQGVAVPSPWRLALRWLPPEKWEVMHLKHPWDAARGVLGMIYRRWWVCSSLLA